MKRLKKLKKNINEWVRPFYKFSFVDEVPEIIANNIILIVGNKMHPWLLAFKCPCGCNDLIQLNLLQNVYPCWKYRIKNNRLSITPSIWRTKGCKSHFFIRKSNVAFVRNIKEN